MAIINRKSFYQTLSYYYWEASIRSVVVSFIPKDTPDIEILQNKFLTFINAKPKGNEI
jgi:hypothetical protein